MMPQCDDCGMAMDDCICDELTRSEGNVRRLKAEVTMLKDAIEGWRRENERLRRLMEELRALVEELRAQVEQAGNLLSTLEQTPEVDHVLTCLSVSLVRIKDELARAEDV